MPYALLFNSVSRRIPIITSSLCHPISHLASDSISDLAPVSYSGSGYILIHCLNIVSNTFCCSVRVVASTAHFPSFLTKYARLKKSYARAVFVPGPNINLARIKLDIIGMLELMQ